MKLTKLITLAALGVVEGLDLRNLGAEDSCSSTALSHESKIIAGYMTAGWGTEVKISKAAEKGYNVVIPSFIKIDGTNKPIWYDNTFNAYGDWGTAKADNATFIKALKDDIKKAKDDYDLKYVLASTGGGSNLFSPSSTKSKDTLATEIKDFLDTFGLDGIDFDIEHLGTANSHINETYLFDLITKLREKKSDMIITGAPQVNKITEYSTDKISFVNSGTKNIYKKAAKGKNCFDYLFAQEYNTANYHVKDGKICDSSNTVGCYTQKDVEFMKHSYKALSDSIHANTKLVIGQPALAADAVGDGHIYHDYKSNIYTLMATEYGTIAGDSTNYPKFGGAMTWQIAGDKGNSWKFVNAIEPKVVNAVANRD